MKNQFMFSVRKNYWQGYNETVSKLKGNFLIAFMLFLFSSSSLFASNYYWVNGTGNWSEFTLHWATSSGGSTFHSQLPDTNDNVFFDVNSFPNINDTLNIDLDSVVCHSMDWSSVTNNPVIINNTSYNISYPFIIINGSLTISPIIQWNLFAVFVFNSSQIGNSINMAGLDLSMGNSSAGFQFEGSGSWELINDISVTSISLINGTFNSNGFMIKSNFYVPQFSLSNLPVCNMGNSNIVGDVRIDNSSLIIDADSALFNSGSFEVNAPIYFDTVICEYNFNCKGTTINALICHQMSGDSNLINMVEFLSDTFCISYPTYCNYIFGNGNVFGKANIHAYEFRIFGNTLFDTLLFTNFGQQLILNGDTISVLDELSLSNTCNQTTNIISPDISSVLSFPASFSTLDNFYFQNIANGSGTTVTFNNSIDGGGNYGWNFNPPTAKTLFWVGGSGNWSDSNHWSTSSGGPGGNCVPTKLDSLFFDGNSFLAQGDTVVFDSQYSYCKYFNAIDALNGPTFFEKASNAKLSIEGSFLLSSNINWNDGPNLNLSSQAIGNIIHTSATYIGSQISILGNGSWDLLSGLNVKELNAYGGFINTNNFNVFGDLTTNFTTNGLTINFGTSQLSGSNYQMLLGNNVNLNADSAQFNFNNYFYSSKGVNYTNVIAGIIYSDSCNFKKISCSSFYGINSIVDEMDSVTYIGGTNTLCKKVLVAAKQLYMSGSSLLIDSLLFPQAGADVFISTNAALNVTEYTNLNGTCGDFASLICNSGNALFNYSGGTFVADYIKLQNIQAIGSNTFTANNCIDLGSNTNWIINTVSPRNLYWVGGAGNWMDFNHWSLTSGGPGGACVPNHKDNLFFDANSFLSIGDTVFSGTEEVQFHTLDARGVLNYPTVLFESILVKVHGSFYLGSNMIVTLNSRLVFVSDSSSNIIQTNGTPLTGTFQNASVYFSGHGSWELQSDLVVDVLFHEKGIFKTNNYAITAYYYETRWLANQDDSLFLGTSILHIDNIMFSNPDIFVDVDSCTFIAEEFRTYNSNVNFNEVFSDYIYSLGANFKFVECETISGGFNYVEKVNFKNNAMSGGTNFFDKIILNTNLIVNGSCNIDTLILNSPGQTVLFYPQSQLNVNNYFHIQSNPNTPTILRGVNGKIGKINLLTDTLCTDHIILQNIEAIGPGVFYAGSNSLDLGNNTGWNFSSCAIDSSTVWPGDANADLIADNLDYLAIGVAYGFSGNTRQNASLNWIPQPCLDWNYQFVNGKNYNNSDCDGNGIVNSTDTLAIIANYGLTHPLRMPSVDQSSTIGVPLSFEMPTSSLVPGTVVTIPIVLGTSLFPANNTYGIAFTINYDPSFVQAGSMQLDITNSWLGDGSNSIHIGKDQFSNGQFDVGFVRIDHQNISGNGMSATLSFTVANGVSGLFNLSFTKVVAIDKYEYSIPIQPLSSSIYTSLFEDLTLEYLINVFPNPASDYLVVISPSEIINQITCFNPIGKELFSVKGNSRQLEFSTQSLREGVYVLRIETSKGVINKRIVIKK